MMGAVPSFQAHSCSSDSKPFNGAKIYLVHVHNPHFEKQLQTVRNNYLLCLQWVGS